MSFIATRSHCLKSSLSSVPRMTVWKEDTLARQLTKWIRSNCGLIIRRNLEMINWLSIADPMPGPLDHIIDEWDCEQLRRGRPQPVESTIHSKTLQSLGQSTEGPACLTSGVNCNERCPCVRNVITRPTLGSAAVKSVLMGHVTNRSELETWVAAITEHTPEEPYSLLCALASTESMDAWQEDRQLVFIATESWRAELTTQAKAAFQNKGLALDDFMTRHGMPHVGMHIDQEFDLPVSVAVVSHDGRAMVDCDCVPALAFNPAFIPAHVRRSVQCLNEEAKFDNSDKEFASYFSLPTFPMLTRIMVPGNAYPLG